MKISDLQIPVGRTVEEAEERLLSGVLNGNLIEVTCPLTHTFAPGVYAREVTMPAGSFIIGHEHKTKHINVVLSGRALVSINGETFHLEAPHTFVSDPGVRKVLYILEEMRFLTIHPTDETDLDKLEQELIVKSVTHQTYIDDLNKLRALIEKDHESPREISAVPGES